MKGYPGDHHYVELTNQNLLRGYSSKEQVFIQNEAIVNLAPNDAGFFGEQETAPNGFAPINIKNASYTWKTNKFSQKLFQYDLEWEMSNINIGR